MVSEKVKNELYPNEILAKVLFLHLVTLANLCENKTDRKIYQITIVMENIMVCMILLHIRNMLVK